MDQETLVILDFPRVLEIIARLAHSPLGKEKVLQLRPQQEEGLIGARLERLSQALEYRRSEGRVGFHDLGDPRSHLEQLGVEGALLEPQALLDLLRLLRLSESIRKTFLGRKDWLGGCASRLPRLGEVARQIERSIDPSGEIRDGADPELSRVRRLQARLRQRIQERLEGYFRGPTARHLIQDPYVTRRQGRFVIPVRAEQGREIEGVVHASSSSGATLFLEPLPVVPLNNEAIEARERERQCILRILRQLTGELRGHLEECWQMVALLGELDALFACAEFALEKKCVVPRLSSCQRLRLSAARHPLLIESLGEEEVVPIDVELESEASALVISGPNTGGKTVALKTIGLFSLMAQAGLPLCASRAEVPFFSQILADIGDHQSIEEHLSTFSAHVLRLGSMIESLGPGSLVLLDEVGRGTDPVHGAALGIALIHYFRERGARVVATTHHGALKALALSQAGVVNASVRFDPQTLSPLYRLEFGVAGASSGIAIAGRLGLPRAIVDQARRLLEEKDLQAEKYLEALAEEVRRLEDLEQRREEKLAELERAEEERARLALEARRRLEREAEDSLEKLAREFRRQADRWIRSREDRFQAAHLRRAARQREAALKEAFREQVRRQREESSGEPPVEAAFHAGEWAFHRLFGKTGRVLRVAEGEALLEIDGKRVAARLDQLEPRPAPATPPLPENVTLTVELDERRELNLVGVRVEEALERTDKFLDRAFLSSQEEVRIIHGFGTGRLRAALEEFLQGHPQVAGVSVEGGATRVTLRR